jgi:pyruvate dehydrogenase E1 component beta subunit
MTETLTYREAIARAIAEEMALDEDIVLLGEDVAAAGGAFKLTEGLLERFGDGRVLDTPISEQAIIGTAIGAAAQGLRPLAEIMFADFSAVCFDGIANQLAKYRYMTGGQVGVPVTIRMANGAGTGFAAQHSQPVENWFIGVAGLKIATPATPADMYGLLRSALRDDDPVLVFEHKALFNLKGEVPTGPSAPPVPLGRAEVVRTGRHVTVVATQAMRHVALEAAGDLASEGIEAEVIDPRTLVPFDMDAVRGSLERTARLVVVQEAPPPASWGASLVARVAQERFEMLDAPPLLVAADETPVPYSGPLEAAWMPDAARVRDAVRATVAY